MKDPVERKENGAIKIRKVTGKVFKNKNSDHYQTSIVNGTMSMEMTGVEQDVAIVVPGKSVVPCNSKDVGKTEGLQGDHAPGTAFWREIGLFAYEAKRISAESKMVKKADLNTWERFRAWTEEAAGYEMIKMCEMTEEILDAACNTISGRKPQSMTILNSNLRDTQYGQPV